MKNFELVTLEDVALIDYYLKKAKHQESNHNLINMFIWKSMFPLYKYVEKDFMLLVSKHLSQPFLFMPLCEKQHIEKAIKKGKQLFDQEGLTFIMSATTNAVKEVAVSLFNDLVITKARDGYDYVYEKEKIISLSGKKLQKRRNLLNKFKRDYEDRVMLAPLHCLVDEVKAFLLTLDEDVNDEYLQHERLGIVLFLDNLELFDYQGAVLLIDREVKGFIVTSLLDETMVQINVEKADKSVAGIFQYLESEYFKMFYPDIQYINKEDDMGRENLRKAKLASKPIKMIEKYRLCQGDCDDKKGIYARQD